MFSRKNYLRVLAINRFLSILLIIALLAPYMAPFAFAFSSADVQENNHYCELSKGPCKHGDACPIQHGHKKNRHDTHEMSHEHHKAKDKEKTSHLVSSCHTSEDDSKLPPPHRDDPFIKTEIFILTEKVTQRHPRGAHLYKNPVSVIADKPPTL